MLFEKEIKDWGNQDIFAKNKFLRELSVTEAEFDEWYELYTSFYEMKRSTPNHIDDTIKKMIAIRMVEAAKGFHDWGIICDSTTIPSIRKAVQEKMLAAAVTLKDYCLLFHHIKNKDIRPVLLDWMIGRAKTFDDWLLVNEYGPKTVKFKAEVFRILESLAESPRELDIVEKIIEEEKRCSPNYIQELQEKVKTFEEWYDLYRCSLAGSDTEEATLKKMGETVESAEQWKKCLFSPIDYPILWKRIKASRYLINNGLLSDMPAIDLDEEYCIFWEWYDVLIFAKEEEIEKYALKKLLDMADSFWEWEKLYHALSQGDENKDMIIEKMRETAETDEEKKRVSLIIRIKNDNAKA
ncbi:MAG: hypothetical protein PHW52_05115 [Candidatus Pacebacteria bacterium]|nr:hypothetical protein [Candidatus Paceibacterota bacterium]